MFFYDVTVGIVRIVSFGENVPTLHVTCWIIFALTPFEMMRPKVLV